ncbi:hypothetical protein G9A89_019874 [Geosiphon pyriformis]|nr:hypothetical protein G9A89_019874 [Geosiphon pyriformis]
MTDFGLTNGYRVYNGLNQGEVFSPFLWCIFYDPLLCKVKRQENMCGYRLSSHFILRNGCAESWAGLFSFFAAGAFIDDTIWKRLDFHGFVPEWFKLSVVFLDGKGFSLTHPSVLDGVGSLNIFKSSDFVSVCNRFSQVGADSLSVYTDWSLSNLDTVGCRAGTTAFFKDINLGLGISVSGLMSSILAELQAIALALESVLLLGSVKLFLDS